MASYTLLRDALPALTFLVGLLSKGGIDYIFNLSTNKALEELKAELRRRELDAQNATSERAAVRKMMLDQLTSRSTVLESKQIEAAEKVWAAVVELAPFRLLGDLTKSVKLEKLMQSAEGTSTLAEKAQQFAQALLDSATGATDFMQATKGRPPVRLELFVSARVWALFECYRSVVILPFTYLTIAKGGFGSSMLNEPTDIIGRVESSLPHMTSYIDEYGVSSFPYLYDHLEQAILRGLREDLGSTSPTSQVMHVAAIDHAIVSGATEKEAPEPPAGMKSTVPPPPS